MIVVPSTIAAPAAFTIAFYTPALGVDLTTITGVSFSMLRKDGTQATLLASIVSRSQTELIAQYQFVGGEITTTGAYLLAPMLSVVGGFYPAETVTMMVTTPWQGTPKLQGQAWVTASTFLSGSPYAPTWVKIPTYGAELVSSGSPYAIAPGITANAVNLIGGAVIANVVNGASDGETKTFVATTPSAASNPNTLTLSAAAGNLFYTGNGGAAAGSVSFNGAFEVVLTWIAAANSGNGGWYL